jgi:hypothetical protein
VVAPLTRPGYANRSSYSVLSDFAEDTFVAPNTNRPRSLARQRDATLTLKNLLHWLWHVRELWQKHSLVRVARNYDFSGLCWFFLPELFPCLFWHNPSKDDEPKIAPKLPTVQLLGIT